MDPFEAKVFEGATTEQKLEVAVRVLGQAAKAVVLAAGLISDIADRLDEAVKRFEQKSWEKAVNTELERREKKRASSSRNLQRLGRGIQRGHVQGHGAPADLLLLWGPDLSRLDSLGSDYVSLGNRTTA